MYIPSIITILPISPPPTPKLPKHKKDLIATTTKEVVERFEKMNPVAKKAAVVVGLGVVGLVVAGRLMPNKKQTVIWEMNGELDKANEGLDKERQKIFG